MCFYFRRQQHSFPSPSSSPSSFLAQIPNPFPMSAPCRETCWSKGTRSSRKCHIACFCTTLPLQKSASSTCGRLSFVQRDPGNQSPDAMKGLPRRDLNFTPLVEVFPGQSQGTLAAKGKENFTATAPWVSFTGELSTSVPSAISCTFSRNIFLTEACVLGLLWQWQNSSVWGQSFWELKMKVFLLTCFLWSLMEPSLNAFCSEENRLSQFNIMQGQQKT